MSFKDKLDAALDKAKRAFGSGKESLAEKSQEVREEARKGLDAAREKAQEALETGKESLEELKKKRES